MAYSQINREGGLAGKPDKPTGTILDDYRTNGATSSNYWDNRINEIYAKGSGYSSGNYNYVKDHFTNLLRYNYGSKIYARTYQDRTRYKYIPGERKYLRSLSSYRERLTPGYTKQIGDFDPQANK